MFHIGRSGSTVLSDMLSQHPKIIWDGEIYEKIISNYEKSHGTIKSEDISIRPYKLIKERISNNINANYGFEVKFFHLNFIKVALKDYIEKINHLGFNKIIILKRKNYLRKIVSSLIATKSGLWFKSSNKEPVHNEIKKLYLDVNLIKVDRMEASLNDLLDLYDSNFKNLESLTADLNVLALEYESDIQSNPYIGYEKIMNYLELSEANPAVRLSRTNPESLNLILENYEEVKVYLSNTRHGWMIEG